MQNNAKSDSYLLISHDKTIKMYICVRVLVMFIECKEKYETELAKLRDSSKESHGVEDGDTNSIDLADGVINTEEVDKLSQQVNGK